MDEVREDRRRERDEVRVSVNVSGRPHSQCQAG